MPSALSLLFAEEATTATAKVEDELEPGGREESIWTNMWKCSCGERKMAVVLIHNDDDDREHDRDADDDDFGGAMFFKTMNTHFLPVCATHTTHVQTYG